MKFDVLIVGDPRFPGGTSTSIASDIQAMKRAGYSVGLLPIYGQVLVKPHPVNPAIRKLIENGSVQLVSNDARAEARLCLLHHPQVFSAYPNRPLDIRAETFLLVTHHPPLDANGDEAFDVAEIARITTDLFGSVTWAPVGPKVRAEFRGMTAAPDLTARDWLNIIDVDEFRLPREGFRSARPVIGRHSRPDPLKWPDTKKEFLQAYPAGDKTRVRLMGYGAQQAQLIGQPPANWDLLEFDSMPVRQFLGTIDFFSYYTSDTWIEAFGRSILEAIASGAVAVLPDHFEPLFGEAAFYSNSAGVEDLVLGLHADQIGHERHIAAARDYVREKFSLDEGARRVRELIGPPENSSRRVHAVAPASNGKTLFFTSNGVGMGHLTRALAVARRVGDSSTPVLATLSKAFGVAEADGIESTYLPYHKSVGLDYHEWQIALQRDIGDLLAYHRPSVFVFDGNVPYPGMVAAFDNFPETRKIWQRRGMWAPDTGSHHLKDERFFDAVIEPAELAGAFDRGLTREHRDRTIPVDPILYLSEAERLPRETARAELGIPEETTAVLLQLGSENNFDLSSTRKFVLHKLGDRPDIVLVNAEWLIRNEAPDLPRGVMSLRKFPIARYLEAFDFAISSAGYNTFHENVFSALPTIFVANENPEQDEQWRRAHYAEIRGLALSSRRFNLNALDAAIDRMLETDARRLMRETCLDLPYPDGAAQAAAFITENAFFRR